METHEYIESGILELYVYGLLTHEQNLEVHKMAKSNLDIDTEIINIEKSILNLSSSFAPFLSVENFEKIKAKLEMKHGKVIQLQSNSNRYNNIGWTAAAVFLIGIGFLYREQTNIKEDIVSLKKERASLSEAAVSAENKSKQNKKTLDIIRDSKNTIVNLEGQTVSPNSFALVYWDKAKQTVYVDAFGLPVPPKGMVYQVWSLKLKPSLTPTNIGLLKDFSNESNRFYEVNKTSDAEAFGITLEPAGGSKTPTMEQLFAMGSV
jgi:anti-sigma-K factor RskA